MFALGNILCNAYVAARGAVCAVQHGCFHIYPDQSTIFAPSLPFDLSFFSVGYRLQVLLKFCRSMIQVGYIIVKVESCDGVTDHFVWSIAEDAFCALVPVGDFPLQVGHNDAVSDMAQDIRLKLLLFLRLFLGGDVTEKNGDVVG